MSFLVQEHGGADQHQHRDHEDQQHRERGDGRVDVVAQAHPHAAGRGDGLDRGDEKRHAETLLHKSADDQAPPFPRTELSHGHRNGYAERGVTVHDGDTDLDFRNLTVAIPGHEALAQQFHSVHPLTGRVFPKEMSREVSSRRGFGGGIRSMHCPAGASAGCCREGLPDGATEVFRRAKRLVARDCACCCGFPGLGVPAGVKGGPELIRWINSALNWRSPGGMTACAPRSAIASWHLRVS